MKNNTVLNVNDFAPRIPGKKVVVREPSQPREANSVYSARTVARAKALLISGMKVSAVAWLMKVPFNTVRDWKTGKRCIDVPADESVLAYLRTLPDKPNERIAAVSTPVGGAGPHRERGPE